MSSGAGALIAQDRGRRFIPLHHDQPLVPGVRAVVLLRGLRQHRDVLGHDARLEARIRIGLDAVRRIVEARAARDGGRQTRGHRPCDAAGPFGCIAHPRDHVLQRHGRRDLHPRQHAREIARHEGDFGIGLGAGRIVRRHRIAAAVVHQQARRVELRHVRGQLRQRERQVRGDAHIGTHAHHLAVAGTHVGGDADHLARRVRFAGGRKLVALAHDGCGALGEGAAQRRLDPLGQRGEVRLAVERNENGAAHQRGAAQAGENRAGEPLNGNATAIDQSDRRAVHQQWRFVAEIDRLSGWSQTIWIAPSALIQAPCPLHRFAVTRLRRGPPQVPSLCSTERIAPWRTASRCASALAHVVT